VFIEEFFCEHRGLESEDEVLEAAVEVLRGDYELEGLAGATERRGGCGESGCGRSR
jgi:hypothetical protein